MHRPTFVFARGQDGLLKGSGRSIPGFHLRDALDLVSKRHPGVLLRFGGHAMAAGCTIARERLPTFDARRCSRWRASGWTPATLARKLLTDGPLPPSTSTPETVRTLDAQVWGQAFEPPVFCDEVEVVSQRLVGEQAPEAAASRHGRRRCATRSGSATPNRCRRACAWPTALSVDEYNGRERVQMVVEAAQAV